jgi:archaellum biogenesis ATPase FlaH
MTEIPIQLQNKEFRFIKIDNKSKIAIEKEWEKTNNYVFNDNNITNWIGNIGIVTGFGSLIVLDIDNKDLLSEINFNTLTVETGSGGKHFYFICKDKFEQSYFRLQDNGGELRVQTSYILTPNSIHPNGNTYKIINSTNILEISKDELLRKIGKLLIKQLDTGTNQATVTKDFLIKKVLPNLDEQTNLLIITATEELNLKSKGFPSRSERDQHVITKLLINGYGKYIKSIFENFNIGDKYKEHPAPDKYLEHNITSARGFTGIEQDLFVELEREIENMNERVLRNKIDFYLSKIAEINNNLHRTYLLSKTAFKIKIPKKDLEKKIEAIKELESSNQHFFSAMEIFNLDSPEISFYIENLIPKNSLILIQGKPGQFKSMLALLMCISLKTTKPFLNKFNILEKPNIIYYDLENEILEIRKRLMYGINGIAEKPEKILSENFHIEKVFKKLNKKDEVEKCMKFDLIVLDSYRRFLEGDENKSDVTNKFYNEFIKPLLDAGKTIIILAHEKKGDYENFGYEGGRMEMIRGSGDIGAQADLCLAITKTSEVRKIGSRNKILDLFISIEKNRKGIDIEEFNFKAEKDDENKQTVLTFVKEGRPPKAKDKVVEKILEFLGNKENADRIVIVEYVVKSLNSSDAAVDRVLRQLVQTGIIFQPSFGVYSLNSK